MDFYKVMTRTKKSNNRFTDYEVVPEFMNDISNDLVCKGNIFYAFWNDGKWDTKQPHLFYAIDKEVKGKAKQLAEENPGSKISSKLIIENSSGKRKEFLEYCKYPERQCDAPFNTKIYFSKDSPGKEDYSTTKLSYTPIAGPTDNFDKLIGRLYNQEEQDKILWFMGALLTNSMMDIQKFLFLYGGKGTGKGTVLIIFGMLFENYKKSISLKKLCSGSEFGTSEVEELPLLIDYECNISKIDDDTNLLKMVSHEPISKNGKYAQPYPVVFPGLLIAASNQKYQVRNIDSGITRRAVVAEPTGFTWDGKTYRKLMKGIEFEIPHIAQKAMDKFNSIGSTYYDTYVNTQMLETDIMYRFVKENYENLGDVCTLKRATDLFNAFLDDYGYDAKGSTKQKVKTELQRYYRKYLEQKKIDGTSVKNVFEGLKMEAIFPNQEPASEAIEEDDECWIKLEEHANSIMEQDILDCPAQYAIINDKGREVPKYSWDKCWTKLKDIDTRQIHYVRVPLNHIVIDFDMKVNGEKSLEKNIEAASKFPPTYAEVSKSGNGLHLHYIYEGDVTQLEKCYEGNKDIEIKVFSGKMPLRRRLTLCNMLAVAHISSGLTLKEEKPEVFKDQADFVYNNKQLHEKIAKALTNKQSRGAPHDHHAPNMSWIHHIVMTAYNNGVLYDITDMKEDIHTFAQCSNNQADFCISLANEIVYSTKPEESFEEHNDTRILPKELLYGMDVEVFPNISFVCYKKYKQEKYECIFYAEHASKDEIEYFVNSVIPELRKENIEVHLCRTAGEMSRAIETFCRKPFYGFNNREYDNHICASWYYGDPAYVTSKTIFESNRRTNKEKPYQNSNSGRYKGAQEWSYLDLYEMSAAKQSLKKHEIDMGILHDELEYNFDEPLDVSRWLRAILYCCHDVYATECLLDYLHADYKARCCLCALSGLSMNTPTRRHAEVILFEGVKNPQRYFNYVHLEEEFPGYKFNKFGIDVNEFRFPSPEETPVKTNTKGEMVRTVLEDNEKNRLSLFKKCKSIYLGDAPSEGGYVYTEPGIYFNVGLLDIASLHPASIIAMQYFGKFTKNFADLRQARIYIKHKELDKVKDLFDGKLTPFVTDIDEAKDLSYALKIVINSIYGYTMAGFANSFKMDENVDNIVAKRGALFMILLKHEVQKQGYRVVHIKTDSIKIANVDDYIIKFVTDFGKQYGYDFELEHIYKRMCLINKSEYIAQLEDGSWSATGDAFAQPFIFKTLFSGEPLTVDDFVETKEVKSPAAIYLGDQFVGKNASVYVSSTGEEMYRVCDDKSGYVTGTKGWKWKLGKPNDILDVDMAYYESLRDKAIQSINLVGPSTDIIAQDGPFDLTYY